MKRRDFVRIAAGVVAAGFGLGAAGCAAGANSGASGAGANSNLSADGANAGSAGGAAGAKRLKIAVLAASGKAGRLIVAEALLRGHDVVAFVRNKCKFYAAQKELGGASAAQRRAFQGGIKAALAVENNGADGAGKIADGTGADGTGADGTGKIAAGTGANSNLVSAAGSSRRAAASAANSNLPRASATPATKTTTPATNLGTLTIIERDIFALTAADLQGFDAVIDAFGTWREMSLYKKHGEHLAGILRGSTARLFVVGGAGSLYVDEKKTMLLDTATFPSAHRGVAVAHSELLAFLRTQRRLRWVYVSPAASFDFAAARTGRYRLAGEWLTTNAAGKSEISYADYASAMLDAVQDTSLVRVRISAVGV